MLSVKLGSGGGGDRRGSESDRHPSFLPPRIFKPGRWKGGSYESLSRNARGGGGGQRLPSPVPPIQTLKLALQNSARAPSPILPSPSLLVSPLPGCRVLRELYNSITCGLVSTSSVFGKKFSPKKSSQLYMFPHHMSCQVLP